MYTFDDKTAFLDAMQYKYQDKGTYERYIPWYRIGNVILIVILAYSAFTSYSFFHAWLFSAHEYGVYFGWALSIALSVLIYKLSDHAFEVMYKTRTLDGPTMLLFLLLIGGGYADWYGTQGFATQHHQKPIDDKTLTIENNRTSEFKHIDNQIAQVDQDIAIQVAKENNNAKWRKLPKAQAETNRKWDYYNMWEAARKQQKILKSKKEDLNKQRTAIGERYSKLTSGALQQFDLEYGQWQNKVKVTTERLRGALLVCYILMITINIWKTNFQLKCLREDPSPHRNIVTARQTPQALPPIQHTPNQPVTQHVKQSNKGVLNIKQQTTSSAIDAAITEYPNTYKLLRQRYSLSQSHTIALQKYGENCSQYKRQKMYHYIKNNNLYLDTPTGNAPEPKSKPKITVTDSDFFNTMIDDRNSSGQGNVRWKHQN